MSSLNGHQFFAAEIQDVLALAANTSMNLYTETDDPAWLSANVNIVSTKVKVNRLAMDDDERVESGESPILIRKGDAVWSEIANVLEPVQDYQQVSAGIDALPRDTGVLAAAPSWMRPAAVAAGLALVGAIGFAWASKPLRRR